MIGMRRTCSHDCRFGVLLWTRARFRARPNTADDRRAPGSRIVLPRSAKRGDLRGDIWFRWTLRAHNRQIPIRCPAARGICLTRCCSRQFSRGSIRPGRRRTISSAASSRGRRSSSIRQSAGRVFRRRSDCHRGTASSTERIACRLPRPCEPSRSARRSP